MVLTTIPKAEVIMLVIRLYCKCTKIFFQITLSSKLKQFIRRTGSAKTSLNFNFQ